MPVADTQPVYPPIAGAPVEGVWGIAVSEHVIQRFTDVADRDLKWIAPPTGAICVTVSPLVAWMWDGSKWNPFGGTLPGEIKIWPGGTIPPNYLMCDGRAISRTTYTALFSVIGTSWGAGDGTTTFNIPDIRDRVPVGAGAGRALTAKWGNDLTQLNSAHLPSHYHSVNIGASTDTQGGHQHTYDSSGWPLNVALMRSPSPGAGWVMGQGIHQTGEARFLLFTTGMGNNNDMHYFTYYQVAGAHAHNLGVNGNTGWQGGNAAFENCQPSVGVNYMIYTGI